MDCGNHNFTPTERVKFIQFFKYYVSYWGRSNIINPEIINHLVKPSGINLSFPSNHAANNAVLAVIFSSIYDNLKHVFWGMAIIIMFSRVYIGVHYPLDVIFGCILGIFYGLLLVKGWDYFVKNKDLKLTI